MTYSEKKKSIVVSETAQHINANLQYFSNALAVCILREPDSFPWEQPTTTICCVGSLFPLLKGSDSLAWPGKQNNVLYTHKKRF